MLGAACSAAVAVLSLLTFAEIGYWKSPESILRRALAVTRDNSLVHNNLARILADQGRLDEAIEETRASVKANFDVVNATNLGNLLNKRGRYLEAINTLRMSLQGMPGNVQAGFELASALSAVGYLDQAEAEFRLVISEHPGCAPARLGYGALLMRQRRSTEAEGEYGLAEQLFRRFSPATRATSRRTRRWMA